MSRLIASALIVTMALGISGARAGAPPGTYVYAVHHPSYGDIGTFTNIVTHEGAEDVVVDTKVRIAIKILFIVVHREEADRREVWRHGRLMAYDSLTTKNGTTVTVKGRANGTTFIIDGAEGRVEAPAAVHPSNPWSIAITDKKLLLATASGKLLRVKAAPAGEESIDIGAKQVKARRFKVTGDMELELWYDAGGVIVKFSYVDDGEPVEFTLR